MTGGQENRREVGRGGNLVRGGDVPSRRVSPGDTIRVGLKDGGGRRENFFFSPLQGGMLALSLARDGRWEVVEERVERGVTG